MKIAFDHQTFTWQSYGGISRYFARVAREFLVHGEDVSIFAGIHRNNYLDSLPRKVVKGRKLNKYPPKTHRIFQTLNHYWSSREIEYWQPDIVHETYYSTIHSEKKTAPIVVTVHDMIHELYPKMFSIRDPTTRWKKRALSRADHIISVSHNTKADLVELFDIKPEKISVIYHGVDNTVAKKIECERPFLLYVGHRNGYKNFNRFLQAISVSKRLIRDLDVVAFGGGAFGSNELKFIESLGFNKGQVKHKTGEDDVLSGLYSSAIAMIYPSLYEGFGLPLIEAMAHGCPVISSNTSSIPEIVRDAAELFDPNKNIEICLAIENVVFSPLRQLELKRNGLLRVKNFSWKKCAEETLGVYEKL